MVLTLSVWICIMLLNQLVSSDNIVGDTKRWRNNQYIRNDSILPYQMCDAATQFSRSDSVLLNINIDNFDFLILAASVWGKSIETGEPKSIENIELAVFPSRAGTNFDLCCGGHAFTHVVFANTIMQQVLATCVLSTATNETVKTTAGIWNYTVPTYIPVGTIEHPGVMSLRCPLDLNSGSGSFDAFMASDQLKLTIVLETLSSKSRQANASLDIHLCYEHVGAAEEVVVITEPIYGLKNHHVFAKQFWYGEPRYVGHTLLDAYILFHARVMGASVHINALHGEADAIMDKYRDRVKVAYRPSWHKVLPKGQKTLHDDGASLLLETLAYTQGHWENRFRAKYVMIVHAADNFAMCAVENRTLSQCLADLDFNNISAVMVPTCTGMAVEKAVKVASNNVLQRWPRCHEQNPGRKTMFGDTRHTPVLNPRHSDYVWVHWVPGRRPSFQHSIDFDEAWDVYRLRTEHIMALGRNQSAGLPLHNGPPEPFDRWVGRMGELLQTELERFCVDSNSNSNSKE